MIHNKDRVRVEKECGENQTPPAPTTKAADTPAGVAAASTEAVVTTKPVCIKTKTLIRYRRGRRWRWKWAWKCCHELDAAKQAKQKECLAADKSVFSDSSSEGSFADRPGKNQNRKVNGIEAGEDLRTKTKEEKKKYIRTHF